MLGGVGNIGTMSARRRVIAAAGGGGGGGGVSRSGTSDSNHVHTMSSLNSTFMIPNIVYVSMTSGVNDNTENYSVKDINFTSGSNASHTFYFSIKGRPNTSVFHNDLCLGAIQIHSSSAVVFAGGAEDVSGFSTTFNTSTENPTGETFNGLDSSEAAVSGVRWRVLSSTSSNQTGAADSISTTFQSTSNALPEAGSGVIAQAASTNFIYAETSSPMSTNQFIHFKFTVNLATNAAHKFVVAYNFGVNSSDTGDDKNNNVALYIEN